MINELSKPLDNIGKYSVNKGKLISYKIFSNDELQLIYKQYINVIQFINNKKCIKIYNNIIILYS